MLPAAAKTRAAPLHLLSTCSHPYSSKRATATPRILNTAALFQHGLGAFKNRTPPPAKPAFPAFSSSRISSFTGFMTSGNSNDTEQIYHCGYIGLSRKRRHMHHSQYLPGVPRTNVQDKNGPHAHWCVIAGYVTGEESLLLSKHWGENRLFDINAFKNSNQGHYPVQQTNGISERRALKVQLLKNIIITIRPPQATSGRRGCAC